jgi:uncharacterized membrane protein
MTDVRIAHFVSVLTVGLFAGLLWAFEQGVVPALRTLDASAYARVEQALILNLDAPLPLGVIVVATIAMLVPMYPLVRTWSQRGSWYWRLTLLGWLIFFFGVSLFTIVLNVPINEYVKTWDPANPPADWQQARDSWNTLNQIRTPLNYLAFGLLAWAAMLLPASRKPA